MKALKKIVLWFFIVTIGLAIIGALFGEDTPTVDETTDVSQVEEIIAKEPVAEDLPEQNTEPVTEPTPDETPVVETHTHSFSAATCTTPKTCSCGATDGEKLGHSWSSATCSAPETCSICGATNGSPLSHNYSDGYCTRCGTDDPNYVYEETVWITSGGKRYHSRPGCSNMKNPQEVSVSTAKARGKTPCSKCY